MEENEEEIESVDDFEPNYINLWGFFGSFDVPNSNFLVKYFSTAASKSGSNGSASESHRERLLRELKPMRERMDKDKIKNLSSLLQRDLNDYRVANELIPYLTGRDNDRLAFFPSILAALIPEGFINVEIDNEDDVHYPNSGDSFEKGNFLVTPYNDLWRSHKLKTSGDDYVQIGKMKINPAKTEIVVLDGQHRANAFRVVSGSFKEDRDNETVYDAFYNKVETPDEFSADLPATLIWFETQDGSRIKPRQISRKLFVDVNNNAQSVSKSRTILLNDLEPGSVLTNFFYSLTAEDSSFSKDEFSLLHSGFDINSDLQVSSGHILTLTTPQIFRYVMKWVFFGNRLNNQLNKKRYRLLQDAPKVDRSHTAEFLTNFRKHLKKGGDEYESKLVLDQDTEHEKLYREEYKENIGYAIKVLFDKFEFLSPHYNTCVDLEEDREDWGSSTKKNVWDKAFCGGEGLYYSLKSMPKEKRENNSQVKDLIGAIEEIEKDFSRKRAAKLEECGRKEVTNAYESFRTKAFQVAYFMCFFEEFFDTYPEFSEVDLTDCANDYVEYLSYYNKNEWILILTELKSELIGSAQPADWPAYHKLLLKLLENASDDDEMNFYKDQEKTDVSPEAKIFKKRLKDRLKGWADSRGRKLKSIKKSEITSVTLQDWVEEEKEEVNQLFEECGIETFDIDHDKLAKNFLDDELKSQEED